MGHWTSPSFSSQSRVKHDLAVCGYLCIVHHSQPCRQRSTFAYVFFTLYCGVPRAVQQGGPWAAGLGSASAPMINKKKKQNNPCFHMPCCNSAYSARTTRSADVIRRKRLNASWRALLQLLLITRHRLHRARKPFQVTLTKMCLKFVSKHDSTLTNKLHTLGVVRTASVPHWSPGRFHHMP